MHHEHGSLARPRFPLSRAGLLSLALLSGCARPAAPAAPVPPKVVATGLNGPQGVYVAADGTVWVTDDGLGGSSTFTVPGVQGTGNYGDSARVIKVAPGGAQSVVTSTPSINIPNIGPTGGGKIAVLGNTVYVANGVWNAGFSVARPAKASAVLRLDGAATVEVANLFAFEAATNPDGVPAAQGGIDSHAYGLEAGPDGQLYVADAGANALLKVDPATGGVSLVASLAGQTSGTGAQSVPTGVAFGTDGSAYVSLLSGGPFPSGAAKVVKVTAGVVSDFATGLTMLTDVERGPDGKLYAVSFGSFNPASTAIPFTANAGSIIRLGAGGEKTTVLSGLNYPTSVAFNAAGDAFVTENGLGLPGSGRVVRYSQLTRYAGE